MAGEAIELGILGPVGTLHITGDAAKLLAQLHGLSDSERTHFDPDILLGLPIARLLPMLRHHRGERGEFEVKIRMTGCDHLMIDEFFGRTEVAGEAPLTADDEIAIVIHTRFDR